MPTGPVIGRVRGMTSKVRRDGRVAVLVSPGWGAGWSTWAKEPEDAVFAPDVVAWVEAGKPDDDELMEQFKAAYGYTGGLRDVEIEWLDEGVRFEIDEHDGNERLNVFGSDWGYTA